MKRLLYILFLCLVSVFAKAQTPTDSAYPVKQALGKTPTTIVETNAMKANDGFINGSFTDTTQANLFGYGGKLKYYPGAQIFTTTDTSLWLRNSTATKWLRGAGAVDIDYFDFLNDITLVICFSNGSCDTISMINFNTV